MEDLYLAFIPLNMFVFEVKSQDRSIYNPKNQKVSMQINMKTSVCGIRFSVVIARFVVQVRSFMDQ